MQEQLRAKNDIKIFILYLLRNIGYPLDFANLNDIVLQDGVVGYFDFAECLNELIEAGNIGKQKEGKEVFFFITEQGKAVSDSLQSDILPYIRERSLKSAVRFLDFQRKGWVTDCSVKELDGGRCEFTCFVLEHKKEIMRITITVDSKNSADRMVHNFRHRPETVFKGLMSVLTGEINYLL